ncbi:hypothetical protein ACET85_12240, partial [Aeromonas veronii]
MIKFAPIEPSHRNAISGLQPLIATHRIAASEISTLSSSPLFLSAIEWITNNNRGCRRWRSGRGAQQDGVNLYLNANSTSKCNSRLKIRLLSEVRQKPPV